MQKVVTSRCSLRTSSNFLGVYTCVGVRERAHTGTHLFASHKYEYPEHHRSLSISLLFP